MGPLALTAGLQTLDLAKLHEQILITQVLPGQPPANAPRSSSRQALSLPRRSPRPRNPSRHAGCRAPLDQIVEMLSQRNVELAASNLDLEQEIIQRKALEAALKKSERHYGESLEQSNDSRSSCAGCPTRLSRLRRRSAGRSAANFMTSSPRPSRASTSGLRPWPKRLRATPRVSTEHRPHPAASGEIARIVHRFARELRPTVLDDLGSFPPSIRS